MPAPIALLTDFGLTDSYVGVMKGVIAKITPTTPIIDITHAIRPQDIQHGAYTLAISAPYFPDGTIFCCVVDPGVGSDRPLVAASTKQWTFVFPDNGLLSLLFQKYPAREAVVLDKKMFHLPVTSSTFHGRDIFAPIAAHLALGKGLTYVGSPYNPESLRTLEFVAPLVTTNEVVGHVLHIDHFGNIVTNLQRHHLQDDTGWTVYLTYNRVVRGVESTYTAVPLGAAVAYVGSDGYLEIAIRNGNATNTYDATIGQEVRLQRGVVEPEFPVML